MASRAVAKSFFFSFFFCCVYENNENNIKKLQNEKKVPSLQKYTHLDAKPETTFLRQALSLI